MLLKQCKNLILILPLGIQGRSHTLLVLFLEVSALVDQEFDHLVLIVVDGVVNRTLVLCVLMIEGGAQVDNLLTLTNVALSHRVIDARLPILILPVHAVTAMVAQVVDDERVTLPGGIEQWRLLELVLFSWVNAELDKHLEHLEGQIPVLDNTCMENRRLTEIFGLTDKKLDVDCRLTNKPNNFIDLTALNFIENGLQEGIRLARLQ